MTTTIKNELAQPYPLTAAQIAFFRENGYIKLRHVLSPDTIRYMDETITREVHRLNTQHLPMDQRDTYGKAFLQIMNIWVYSLPAREIVFSESLARIAAELLEVSGVRLYHDQALYKEPGGGQTPWHADQYYWPLATDRTVTVWIPLQETPLPMGPLEFSAGSNHLSTGRDLKIGDESQEVLHRALRDEGYTHVVEPFSLGDVSYHNGWLYHRAGANHTDQMRKVMTMIYMDKDMVLKAPENPNQVNDWNTWCPGAKVGEVIQTARNPILFEKE
ncbi:phytanoyl-CoA dioxygenase family protein [Puia dinghuensis]|uniref:SnoK n=1 Tax=Puia dinghuensis TaxID=1792502 RepID=A0A8J2XWM2_9BACT|nr:phytanoyl-CoA dioxygenase family protein [Puia dinghuensis]GGB24884.1 SnoK [Puia dinghuensis]